MSAMTQVEKLAEIPRQFYYCDCFLRENYFLSELGLHLSMPAELDLTPESVGRHLLQVWQERCSRSGGLANDTVSRCVAELLTERHRRETEDAASCAREASIGREYAYLHPDIFCPDNCAAVLDPRFLALIEAISAGSGEPGPPPLEALGKFGLTPAIEGDTEVLALPVFTELFCRAFLAELANFRTTPLRTGRPNTMNRDGLLLDELTIVRVWLDHLRERYLQPLAAACLHLSASLDSQRAFTVLYDTEGQDWDLGYHYDNCEVTLNVCLADASEFRGSQLFFGGTAGPESGSRFATAAQLAQGFPGVDQRLGWGLLHPGRRMHGVRALLGGRRESLIIWLRASQLRNRCCLRCWRQPRGLVPSGRYGDGMDSLGLTS